MCVYIFLYIYVYVYVYMPWGSKVWTICNYLHAFGYARSQSVRPCYLRSDHDFCMHFRLLIFRLISDRFRQIWGRSCWPYHDVSRSVTAFSDNAQDLSIRFYLVSRFVTVCHAGNSKPIWPFFRQNKISDCHISTMHALFVIIRNDFKFCMHVRFDPIYAHGSSGVGHV